MRDEDQTETPRPPPLQFGLRTVFAITVALALLFGTLEWLGVPPRASFLVLVVLAVSMLAAVVLGVVIAGAGNDER